MVISSGTIRMRRDDVHELGRDFEALSSFLHAAINRPKAARTLTGRQAAQDRPYGSPVISEGDHVNLRMVGKECAQVISITCQDIGSRGDRLRRHQRVHGVRPTGLSK